MEKEHLAYSSFAVFAALNVDAMVGAAIGVVFFMMSPFAETFRQKIGYTIVSLGFGYAAGCAADGSYTMIAAGLTAALSVTGVDTARRMMNSKDGLKTILELVRGFTK